MEKHGIKNYGCLPGCFVKTAIITGVTGQDGAYLSKLLLEKNYSVIGLVRSKNSCDLRGLKFLGIDQDVLIEECNLLDMTNVLSLLQRQEVNEVYNLAAQSSVGTSFVQPLGTIEFNVLSVLNMLESIKRLDGNIRFYQASTSEMFGSIETLPATEKTTVHPLSPYAISKATAHWITVQYRESYHLFASSGILFNHESYLRKENYFIKKLIREALEIRDGRRDCLRVGNIDVRRDFGFAPEYVKAMWLMLQTEKPDDFIVCSGKSILLRDVIGHVFGRFNISEQKLVVDHQLYRPKDIQDIYGDNSKAKKHLNWSYQLDFFDVLDMLIEEELKYAVR
jgi:GDPmannose 4,6-dehydratase